MEAFFHLCGNQIRRCVKVEQRELLSGLSTTLNLEITISLSTRKYQISFENDMAFLRLENVCSTARETSIY